MIQNAFDILDLSGEAAVCTRGSVIRYANGPARALLGQDCVGRPLRELLGEDFAGEQSPSFITDCSIGSRRFTVRLSRIEKGALIFFSSAGADPAILNDPLLFSLRSTLMNMNIVGDNLRAIAVERQDEPLRRNTVSLTHSMFRLMRQVRNAGFVLDLLRGQGAITARPCDLGAICLGAAEAVAGFFPEIRVETALDCSGQINADPALFKLLLNNLLSNCLIHALCTSIRIRLSETPGSLLLSVCDDGIGIPPEALPQAFERYRYHFDPAQIGRGPGLGLSAARGVAQLHGGTLLLESRPGSGTAVRAALSRTLPSHSYLRDGEEADVYSSRDLLVGLADCLPEEAFSEKYLD